MQDPPLKITDRYKISSYKAFNDKYPRRYDTSIWMRICQTSRWDRAVLSELVLGIETLRILDAGCATGRVLYMLARAGARNLAGIDLAPKMIEVASNKLHPKPGAEYRTPFHRKKRNPMIENKTSLRPRYADTDQMGIVYYAKYLEWFEVGRTELLREIGLPYTRIESEGIILPVIEVHCKYYLPAKYDRPVQIISRVTKMPRARIQIDYEIRDKDETLLAAGYTIHSFLGKNGRPVKPPTSLLEKMRPFYENSLVEK